MQTERLETDPEDLHVGFHHTNSYIFFAINDSNNSICHFKLYMIRQLYAKRQQVLSIGYQESLVIRGENLHKKRNFKKCFHPLVIYTTILLK